MRRLEGVAQRAALRTERICRGPLLSRQQYLFDVEQAGFVDARSLAENPMTDGDIATWTAGIQSDGSHQ